MKKKILCVFLMTLLIAITIPVKAQDLDQYSSNDDLMFEFPVQNSYDVAQSFIPTLKKILKIELKIEKVGNPGNFTASIRSNLYDHDIASVTISQDDIPTGKSWVIFDFGRIKITTGETYYIVCSSEGGVIFNYYNWRGSQTDPYQNGHGWLYDSLSGTWNERGDIDFCFKTFGTNSINKAVDYHLHSFFFEKLINRFPLFEKILTQIT